MTHWKHYDPSRWLQDRERFQIANPDPLPLESAHSIRQTIMDIFAGMRSGEQSVWRQVEREWRDLVGSAIARHTSPVRLERKTIVVAVDSAVWLNELIRYERAALLSRLQKRWGADQIKAIHFQADPQATHRNDPSARAAEPN